MIRRHAMLLLALVALGAALLVQSGSVRAALAEIEAMLRWALPAAAIGQTAARLKPEVAAEDIYPPGTLVNHAFRIGRLEDGLREFRAEHLRDIEGIKSSGEWTNRLLIATLVGVIVNLVQQLRGRADRGRDGRDGREGRDR